MTIQATFRFILMLCLFGIFLVRKGFTQDTLIATADEMPYIQWVGQYVSGEEKDAKQLTKIVNIIFGKKKVELKKPVSILAESPDKFWILDQGSGTILQINHEVGEMPRWLNSRENEYSSLVGACFLPNGRILFTDSRTGKIFLSDINQKKTKRLNDSLTLQQPTGIAYSELNNKIYVVETAAHRISILDTAGNLQGYIGKRGDAAGEFNFPTFIWIDKQGNMYIVDSMNFRVQILDKFGKPSSVFGQIGDASGFFACPKGIATDSYGNIYVVDALFHAVQVFNKTGDLLYYFGRQGRGQGEFWLPSGIYIDEENYIYVADSYNSRVQIFQLIKK